MNTHLSICPMQTADIEAALYVQRNSFEPHLLESKTVFENRLQRFGHYFLVVKDGDKVIGYALSFPWQLGSVPANDQPFPQALPAPDSFYLHDITLLTPYRGKGAVQALLSKIYSNATAEGFDKISLVSVAQAGSYWDKQGFTQKNDVSAAMLQYILENYGAGARLMVKSLH